MPLHLNIRDIRESSVLELKSARELIEEELERRKNAKLYVVKAVPADKKHLEVQEASKIEDDDVPHYVSTKIHSSATISLEIDQHSVFHQQPEVGNIFQITLVHGKVVDVAHRVAVH